MSSGASSFLHIKVHFFQIIRKVKLSLLSTSFTTALKIPIPPHQTPASLQVPKFEKVKVGDAAFLAILNIPSRFEYPVAVGVKPVRYLMPQSFSHSFQKRRETFRCISYIRTAGMVEHGGCRPYTPSIILSATHK